MSYIGTTEIGQMFLGDVEIDKAYLGDTLVFQSGPYIPQQYTITLNPSSYSASATVTNPNNGYASETSTTYSSTPMRSGEGLQYMYYKFNTSSIPANAVIDSVTCKAKGGRAYGTFTGTSQMQMYNGSNAKGNAVNIQFNTAAQTFSGETWTRSELSDIGVRVSGTCTSGSTRNLLFYGATLTIVYTA